MFTLILDSFSLEGSTIFFLYHLSFPFFFVYVKFQFITEYNLMTLNNTL